MSPLTLKKSDKFEIGGLLVEYDVELNNYYLTDVSYAARLGYLSLQEGPGWVFLVHSTFLDGGELGVISEMVNALNAELTGG